MSTPSRYNHEDAIRHLVNNKPDDDFCSLTPNEMHRLIYEPYTPESPLKINLEAFVKYSSGSTHY